MRARSLVESPGLVVMVLLVASGCSPDEPSVLAAPDPVPRSSANPAPDPALDPTSVRGLLVSVEQVGPVVNLGGSRDTDDIGDVATPVMTRLIYQCSDEVTFAVRVAGDRLEVFPPGVTNNYVTMQRVPSASGVRYTAANAYFRADRDLATLQIGSERHVDCVSNPAAAVWGAVQPNAAR